MNTAWFRLLFGFSAAYDGVLGIVFLFWGMTIFGQAGVEPPNHPGYVHFPALLLLVFAAMFWRIRQDPVRFRDMIPYGIGLKLSYSAVIFYHQVAGGIPSMWIPFAWIDMLCVPVYLHAWWQTGRARSAAV